MSQKKRPLTHLDSPAGRRPDTTPGLRPLKTTADSIAENMTGSIAENLTDRDAGKQAGSGGKEKNMENLKIVVLCGGLSTERNISFLSGTRVCAALRNRGHRAVLADLFLGFEDADRDESGDVSPDSLVSQEKPPLTHPDSLVSQEKRPLTPAETAFSRIGGHDGRKGDGSSFDPENLFETLPPIPDYQFDGQAPDLEAVRRSRRWKSPSLFGKHVLELCQAADIVFMALHGKNGEDGRVQATFDMLGIPYTGSGHVGAAIAMDKMLTKMVVSSHGVRTPSFRRWEWDDMTNREADIHEDREAFVRLVCAQTDVPCVVKTPDGGSSVGVFIVHKKEDLAAAVRGCLDLGDTFMTEQFIDGKECTCAVLRGQALPSVEIIPKTRFYDYSNKYEAGAAEEICPARVSPEVEKEIGRVALQVHRILGLQTYSRSDFMIDKEDNVWFIEVNTLPGMTKTSLVPQEAAAVGISYEDLCEQIVEDALHRAYAQ